MNVPNRAIPGADHFLAGFRVQRYSKRQVKEAGAIIAAWNPYPYSDEVGDAFRLAHEWRDAHVVPMRAARKELKELARRAKVRGQTAARLKRFQSIRHKLRRRPLSLYQMQDIAGARIIVETIEDVDAVAARYRAQQSQHEYIDEDDYITAPKVGGYRSVHFVLKYAGDEELTGGNRLTVEVQVRTRLQHAWATAVEAVGTVRNEQLKGGQGDRDWLRFFAIMSAEFAMEEGRQLVPNVSDAAGERRTELLELVARLDALNTLSGYRDAIREIDKFESFPGTSFLIELNNITRRVSIKTSPTFRGLAADYEAAEKNEASNAVLVEVDKVGELISAYPNYFLDVEMFTNRLRRLVGVQEIGTDAGDPAPGHRGSPMNEWLARWVMRSNRWRRV